MIEQDERASPDLDMEDHDIQELMTTKDGVIVRGRHPAPSSSPDGEYSMNKWTGYNDIPTPKLRCVSLWRR